MPISQFILANTTRKNLIWHSLLFRLLNLVEAVLFCRWMKNRNKQDSLLQLFLSSIIYWKLCPFLITLLFLHPSTVSLKKWYLKPNQVLIQVNSNIATPHCINRGCIKNKGKAEETGPFLPHIITDLVLYLLLC